MITVLPGIRLATRSAFSVTVSPISYKIISAGLNFKDTVLAASTGALTVLYVNGTLGVGATLTNNGALAAFSTDGQTLAVSSRVLIKDQASALQNGIYTVTVAGSGALAWVLTRATGYDQASEVNPGDLVPVQNGTTLGGSVWLQTVDVTTMGSDSITFSEYLYPAAAFATAAQGSTADAAMPKAGGVFSGDVTMGENAGLVLDAALSADGKYSGVVEAGTSAAALAFGEVCYRVTAGGKWNLARGAAADVGTVVATGELGMCVLAAVGADAATTMLLFGKVRADALFDTFTVGAPVYLSAATAGKTVSAAPTGTTDFTVRKLGFAEDANTVFFRPSDDYITLA